MTTIDPNEEKNRVLADLEYLEQLLQESPYEELYEHSNSMYNLAARNIHKIKDTQEYQLKSRYMTIVNTLMKYLPSHTEEPEPKIQPETSPKPQYQLPKEQPTQVAVPESTNPNIEQRLDNIEQILAKTITYFTQQETAQKESHKKIMTYLQEVKRTIGGFEKNYLKAAPQPILEGISYNVVSHCNLNCKHCTHFAAIVDKHIVPPEVIYADLTHLSKLTEGAISLLKLLGGEPLLHPQLTEILVNVRKIFPNTYIKILTNAILLPRQDEVFWKACHDNEIELTVTKYPINLNYAKIEQIAKQYNVEYVYHAHTDEVTKTMSKMPIDPKGLQDPKRSFWRCRQANKCSLCLEGNIYPCPMVHNAKYFNKAFGTNMIVNKKDYLPLYEIESYEQLLTFLSTPKPFCRYCDSNHVVENLPWGLSEKKIEEWV